MKWIAILTAILVLVGCRSKHVCKHTGRLDNPDNHEAVFPVDITEWAPEGQRVVIGVCAYCGTITKVTTETDNSISVAPVSNSVPVVSFGGYTKSAKQQMDQAQKDLIKRMEESTNAFVIRGCTITGEASKQMWATNCERFVLITDCTFKSEAAGPER